MLHHRAAGDRNCSSAFELMGTYAQATWEGPFGQVSIMMISVYLPSVALTVARQAHEVPQLGTAPWTPFDAEPSFKPVAGVTSPPSIRQPLPPLFHAPPCSSICLLGLLPQPASRLHHSEEIGRPLCR